MRICGDSAMLSASNLGHDVVMRFQPVVWPAMVVTLVCVALSPRRAQATNLPRIDPTGQRIFTSDAPPMSKYKPLPGRPTHNNTMFLRVAPARIIAPVGAEVVLVSSLCGPDGFMRANERVEWMLAPGGVGQFVALGERGFLDCLCNPKEGPRKLDNSYAIGTTSARYVALTRGTPTYDDDVPIQKGQAWVTVTSPVEGASYVTAYAPSVYGWDQRQRTSTIYWVDAQWAFPPPAQNPLGTRHVFTTTLTRQTDRSPLVGWIVRYEITGGPAAGFAPTGGTVIEAPTNALGQASVEIFQDQPAAGTNTVAIQIIRPAELSGSYGQRLVVGQGSTLKTWSESGGLSLRTTGPSQATVGSTVVYRVDVVNPSSVSARRVSVRNPIPRGLSFVSSNPPAQAAGGVLEWQLGDISGGQSVAIEMNFRADQASTASNCATLTTADGLSAQSCATTTIVGAPVPMQSLSVAMTAPPTASVGQDAEFVATITNRGTTPTPRLTIVDRFDAGLQHSTSGSPIERALEPIQPGQSQRIAVTLRAMQAGRLCNSLEVQGTDGSVLATAQACVVAAAGAAVPQARPTITVKKTGPPQLAVGQVADFVIEISNTGAVPATQIRLSDNYDAGLEPTSATDGHNWVGNDLVWVLDTLPAGRSVRYQVQCRCTAPAARACNRATVTTAEGATANDEACLAISGSAAAGPPAAAAGPSRLGITVADLTEPVAVGRNTTYEVKVTNSGPAPEAQVVLTVTLPAQMSPLGVGPIGQSKATILGKTVRFDPVATVQPGETVTYQVQARADQPGQARFRAQATSAANAAGVVGDELTTIFAQ